MYDIFGVNQMLMKHWDDYDKLSADVLFQYWCPLGVIKVEAAPMRSRLGDEKFGSRLVNLVVAYRVKTFNIWGGDIDIGTRMYFIIKRVEVTKETLIEAKNANGKRGKIGQDTIEVSPRGFPMVWKMFPYADRMHDTPPLEVLAYEVQHPYDPKKSFTKYGSYVCIGMASERVTPLSVAGRNVCEKADMIINEFRANNRNGVRLPPQLEIYVTN
jgi:hypothetical protein